MNDYIDLCNNRIFYLLLSGLTYTEIAEKYYQRHKYKFIYQVQKMFKTLNIRNRRQLAYFAIKNNLVDLNRIEVKNEYTDL